ncbi:MAG: phosphotransferase [Chloroflexi bacterium]|nr:phosphotransferase [Chloroflexota bacterium]
MKIESNQSLLQQVLPRYELAAASVYPLRSYNNFVYRVESADKQRFSLRICGFPTMKRRSMEDEMLWLHFVAQRNPRLAPRPIANNQGEWVTAIPTLEGERLCSLFAWVEGSELRNTVTPADLHKVGRCVAALHNVAREFPFPDASNDFRSDYRYDQSLMHDHRGWIGQHRDTIGPAHVELLVRAVDYVLAAMDRIDMTPANYGMIHADLSFGNLLVDEEEIYLIDFEQLGRGHYLYDFAVLWSELHAAVGDFAAGWQSFVAGYGEVAELPFRHQAELNPFIIATQLNHLDWVYNTDNPVVRAEFLPQLPLVYAAIRERLDAFGGYP